MVQFSGEHAAFAHLVLPFGETTPTLCALLSKLKQKNNGGLPEKSRVFQLAGRSDLLYWSPADSFRSIFGLTDKISDKHQSCRWTLGKSYVLKCSASHSSPYAFFTHLRVHRALYKLGGVRTEERIVEGIEALLKDKPICAQLWAAVGWSDLILTGSFPGGRNEFLPFILELRRLTIELGGETYGAFQRAITLLGYEWTSDEKPIAEPENPYMMRFRVKPGYLKTAHAGIEEFLRETLGRPTEADFIVSTTEGKTDLIVVPRLSEGVLIKMKSVHLDPVARNALVALRDKGVEHFEARLGVGDPRDVPDFPPPPEPPPCDCRTRVPRVPLNKQDRRNIPKGIQESIQAIYSLFGCTLRDEDHCCDLLSVVESCHMTLCDILTELRLEIRGSKSPVWIDHSFRELKIWCSRVDKVFGERTAESFPDMFQQNNRLTSLRGDVQKYLLTADRLVREYIRMVRKTLRGVSEISPPVIHYGASARIESDLRAGVVTIPSHYMFSLPTCVPQLWHEVGVRVFNQKYRPGRGGKEIRKMVAGYIENSQIGELNEKKVLISLADNYSDLLLRYCAFADFYEFANYLITLGKTSHVNRGGVASKREYWSVLFRRLLFVYESEDLLLKMNKIDKERPPYFDEIRFGSHYNKNGSKQDEREKFVVNLVRFVVGAVARATPGAEKFFTRPIKQAGAAWASGLGFFKCHWKILDRFLNELRLPLMLAEEDPMLEEHGDSIRKGRLVDLSNVPRLDRYMTRGFLEEIENRSEGSPNREGMAALGRSIFLSSYTRESLVRI